MVLVIGVCVFDFPYILVVDVGGLQSSGDAQGQLIDYIPRSTSQMFFNTNTLAFVASGQRR